MHENLSGDGPDYSLIAPISVPDGNRIPDELTGIATSAEYGRYFRLSRESLDLAAWTRTCLTVRRELLADLGSWAADGDPAMEARSSRLPPVPTP